MSQNIGYSAIISIIWQDIHMNYLELEAISISMRILTGITNSALSNIDISIICKLDYAIKHACIQKPN